MSQIRLARTPEIDNVLTFLRGKYPIMSEAEIIKMALSQKYREEVEESSEKEKQVADAYTYLMSEGKKLGDKFLAKKGLKRENVSEEQFAALLKSR